MTTRSFCKLIFVTCLFMIASQAYAQEVTASLLGQVTDAQGSVIRGAKITITNVDRKTTERTLTSDANGEFVASLLPIGHYSVSVTSPGFKEFNQTGIVLHADDKVTLALALQVGANTEQVTVRADAVQVQLQSMSSEGLITGQEIREISLNTRNPLGLLETLPGVTNTSTDELTIGAASPANLGGSSLTFSMNSSRTTGNDYLIDGADRTSTVAPIIRSSISPAWTRSANTRRSWASIARNSQQCILPNQYHHALRRQPVSRFRVQVPAQRCD